MDGFVQGPGIAGRTRDFLYIQNKNNDFFKTDTLTFQLTRDYALSAYN